MSKINQSELLEKLGIAAFGNTWKADLADRLPVARPTISDWMSGKKPIPVGIWSNIEKILKERLNELKTGLILVSDKKHYIVLQEMLRKGKIIINDEFSHYTFELSDSEIISLLEAYKTEITKLSIEHPNESYADLAVIRDAIQFNICIRNINGNLDLAIAEDCAISYMNNLELIKSFNLDHEFLIHRVKDMVR